MIAAPLLLLGFLLLNLVAATLPVAAAWLVREVVDGLTTDNPDGLVTLAVLLALTGLAVAGLPQWAQYLRAELERAVGLRAQQELFGAVDGFVGLRRFEDPGFVDRLRLAQQAASATPLATVEGSVGLLRGGITLVGFLGSLALISPLMATAVTLAALPMLWAEVVLSRRRASMVWELGPVERREAFYGQLLSSLAAAKEVRLFGAGGFLRGRMTDERRKGNAVRRRTDRRELLIQVGLGLLSAVVAGAGLIWAVRAATMDRITVGDLSLFLTALPAVQGALTTLITDLARVHHSLLLFRHYVAVLRAGPDLPVRAEPTPVPPLRHGLSLRDVWFRYSDDHPWVLRGVNLDIPAGQAVGLVGLNGAGKSTLVKLICRFYDPVRGQILWDGVDLRSFSPEELRRRIGVTFQDYMAYDLSAAENVAIGHLDSLTKPSRIEAAAELAGIHSTLHELPDGYDTLLSRLFISGDRSDARTGVLLSGGQWQRLALARSLIRDDADLLILDEPSSGLDAQAEYEVHKRLRDHRADRTSLLISHRLGTLRNAGLIAVLEAGEVIEQGSHAELMGRDGRYAQLFSLQARNYHDDEYTA